MQTYKLVLIGNTSVGKTSLVTRFAHKRFTDHVSSTIGASFISYVMDIGQDKVRLNIWDTAGQERFRSMVTMYYRHVDMAIIVFDVTNYDIKNLKYWIQEYIRQSDKDDPKFILVGNKRDLLDIESYISDDITDLAESYKTKLFITSALNGHNVEQTFEYIAETLLKESHTFDFHDKNGGYSVLTNVSDIHKCCY